MQHCNKHCARSDYTRALLLLSCAVSRAAPRLVLSVPSAVCCLAHPHTHTHCLLSGAHTHTDAVVINSYQLLKSINPSIELVTELMMPQSVSFLSATTPVRGVDYRYLHLVSPAYVSGSGEA